MRLRLWLRWSLKDFQDGVVSLATYVAIWFVFVQTVVGIGKIVPQLTDNYCYCGQHGFWKIAVYNLFSVLRKDYIRRRQ